MGRDKRNEARGGHFAALSRSMMETPAWRELSPAAQALLPWIKLEWHGPKANNNGRLRLSIRQAAEAMGVDPKTAARAFRDLQRCGFLVVTEAARLGLGGAATSPAYELTEIPLPGADRPTGRRLYEQWRKGRDFLVYRATAQNPRGVNGRSRVVAMKVVK